MNKYNIGDTVIFKETKSLHKIVEIFFLPEKNPDRAVYYLAIDTSPYKLFAYENEIKYDKSKKI